MKLAIASLVSVLAPLAAGSPSVQDRPNHAPLDPVGAASAGALVPGMHGTARGSWRGPEEGLGRLRALLVSPEVSQARFAVDATVVRTVPMGPDAPGIRGSLFGPLVTIDPDAGAVEVGFVLGTWDQDPDGSGRFLAGILVPSADPEGTLALVGFVGGSFRTAPPDSIHTTRGPVDARWAVVD